MQLAKLGEMARTLSHEIKNPLSAMRIQTGYLKKILSNKNQGELNLIEEEIDRLYDLTKKISDFVRNPVGQPEPINLNQFIPSIIQRFDYPIHFEQDKDGSITINFDWGRLRSVLENIISNAIESCQHQSDCGKKPIEIEMLTAKKYFSLIISDTGSGIPDEIHKKIFDPFYTTKTISSGIGLSISKRFIEAMKGSITFLKRPKGRTQVKVLLCLKSKN